METADHVARLERDGVTIVEEVYSQSQLAEIREALTAACDEVRAALPAVTWTEMRYQRELVESDTFWYAPLSVGHSEDHFTGFGL